MELSNGEKLIVVMLADLYKHLKVQGEIDAEFVKSAVLGGHSWAIDWQYSGFSPESDKPAVVEETSKILTMWRILEQSIAKLSEDEQEQLKKHAYPYDIAFGGFDGNNDDHYGVTHFMVEELGRFEERKGGVMNSHSQSELPRYRQMLPRFREVTEGGRYDLKLKELKIVLEGLPE